MDIERKVSGARRTLKRVGTLHRTNSNARRAAARSKVARAEAAGRTPEGMPGIIGASRRCSCWVQSSDVGGRGVWDVG